MTTLGNPRLRTLEIDGKEAAFTPGESVLVVARRCGLQIPTLCDDPRLEAFGSCRLCVVEVQGQRLPVASCTTKAEPGMVVATRTPALEKHRKTILELVASENPPDDHVDPLRGACAQELTQLLDRYAARTRRFAGARSGKSRLDDGNPFILRDYDRCIACWRCVRVCAEREGDHAIAAHGRGFAAKVAAPFDGLLTDSDCTFCGQCVQTCPTGALADRKALAHAHRPEPIQATASVCSYCGVGCSLEILSKGETIVGVRPGRDGKANRGALCIKGQFAFDWVQHPERLKAPMIRASDGKLQAVSWDTALDAAAAGFKRALEAHGASSIFAIASGRAPSEAAYSVQKFIRAGFGTHHVDHCQRA